MPPLLPVPAIYQPPQTPTDSPFRKFDVALLLVCNKCRQWEILPVR